MTHRKLASILDADMVVNIGQENNNNRVHKLFYSERDKICFVAIQDIKTGTVVTVLPIDYHENISWAISLESQNQAKKYFKNEKSDPNDIDILNTNATVFRISGNVTDYYGGYIKTINLGSWPCSPYQYSIDALVKDREFVNFLANKSKEETSNLIDEASYIKTIAIRLGQKGDPVFFSTSELISTRPNA